MMYILSKKLIQIRQIQMVNLALIIFLCFSISSCSNMLEKNPASSTPQASLDDSSKQKGAHVFGRIDSVNVEGFKENNIEWLALVPYGYQEHYQTAEVRYQRGDSLEMKKRDLRWVRQIEAAHEAGYKIFLKPHVWMGEDASGKWRSDIFPTNEENWELWKNSYKEFILHYAKIAESTQVEQFCVGVEFTELTINYPEYWRSIIKEVRSIYSGEITYAANWYKEYENITFWDDLDYIGIQAYFPLTKNDSPTVDEISAGWNKYTPQIKSLAKKYKKKILFTEMGYKSTIDSATEPWTWIDYSNQSNNNLCHVTQANCYRAFFNTVWPEEWMAGLHIWQMRGDHRPEANKNSTDFNPQSKPAEKIIKQGYSSLR